MHTFQGNLCGALILGMMGCVLIVLAESATRWWRIGTGRLPAGSPA
jgi:hypothetical protein